MFVNLNVRNEVCLSICEMSVMSFFLLKSSSRNVRSLDSDLFQMKQNIFVIILNITAVGYLNRHYIHYCSDTLSNTAIMFLQKCENTYIMSSKKTSRLIIALCSLM